MESKQLLQNAVMVAHVNYEMHMGLFCDASDTGWGACLTQVLREDTTKPLLEQQHEPFEFISVTFSGAASRWNIRCKECYSIYISCKKWHHHVSRPKLFHNLDRPQQLELSFGRIHDRYQSKIAQ